MREYWDYCKRFKSYVDFKINNPYSEKDLEFESAPTPRNLSKSYLNLLPTRENEDGDLLSIAVPPQPSPSPHLVERSGNS